MILSFVVFLLMFTLIGVSSVMQSRGTRKDYYIASGTVPSWLVGLSAVATNNSGYMFIGVIGYTYSTGLAAIWIMIGWIVGDFLASTFVHARLRAATQRTGEASYSSVLAHWYRGDQHLLQKLIGIISLVFLLAYAGAQLVAGSKALHVLFEWPEWAGAILGAILVVLYCFAGGIRASIWTDAAQSFVMIFSMGLLLVVAVSALGGMGQAYTEMAQVENFLNWFPEDLMIPGAMGAVFFVVGWLFAGISVIGQPHIMVRFMSLQGDVKMYQARAWYYTWFTLFYLMSTCVGLLSRIYLPDVENFDAELALPTMAIELLPDILVGLILAGIFAATMSTADSLVLSCSAVVTHDLVPRRVENKWLIKLTTVMTTFGALIWALTNEQGVFGLVIMAWSGLASAFAPLLIVLALGGKPSQKLSVVAIIVGFLVALVWRLLGWHNAAYEGMPGILTGLLIYAVGLRLRRPPKANDAALYPG